MKKREIIESVKNSHNGDKATGSLYDLIANNYYQMDKGQLKDVLLETIYTLFEVSERNYISEETNEKLIANLEERLYEDE